MSPRRPPRPSTSPEVASSVQRHRAAGRRAVVCGVITISDTRTEATDTSGAFIRDALRVEGHRLAFYRIVKDEPGAIVAAIEAAAATEGLAAILLNGGTGIASRDRTYETVAGLLERRLDGFGELFRMLSFQEIGPAAMLSRAVAGVYRGRIVFSMPGSTGAVRLAIERLILPELGHVVGELGR